MKLRLAFWRYAVVNRHARALAKAGHAKRRAQVRETTRLLRQELGLPADARLG